MAANDFAEYSVASALVASVGMIVGLVGVLYGRLNKDLTESQEQLIAGQQKFSDLEKEITTIKERLAYSGSGASLSREEIDKLKEAIRIVSMRLNTLETKHDMLHGGEQPDFKRWE